MHAEDLMDEPFVCTYSDILFTGDVVKRLLANPADIALSVDTDWLDRYQHRTEHPPTDAEKVTVANGSSRASIATSIRARRMANTPASRSSRVRGAATLREHYHRCRTAYAGKPFREAAVFEKAYLIHLFQDMIEAGVPMAHADTPGNYIEVDTQQDFEFAQNSWRG